MAASRLLPNANGVAGQRPQPSPAEQKLSLLTVAMGLFISTLPAAAQPDHERIDQDVFIKVEPSTRRVYAGQALTVRYLLYYRVPLIDPDKENSLSFRNCFVEEYPPSSLEQQEIIGGQRYRVKLLKQFLIIPELAGPQPLPVLKHRYRFLATPSAEDFFGQPRMISRDVQSAKLNLQVQPLPPGADSAAFSRAVGQFELKSSYTVSPKAENMLTVRVTLRGLGNLRKFQLPPSLLPAGVDLFNIHRREQHRLVRSGMMAEGEYSYDLVTQYKGQYRLPRVQLFYFDPTKERYIVGNGLPFTWIVTRGLQLPVRPSSLSTPVILAKSPVHYKRSLYQDDRLRLFTGSPGFYSLLLISGALLLTCIGHQKLLRVRAANIGQYRSRQAKRWALRDLKHLERAAFPKSDSNLYYRGLYLILLDYYSHKSGHTRQQSAAFDQALLLSRVGPALLRVRAKDFLNQLDRLRFSAQQLTGINHHYTAELKALINESDSYLHGQPDNLPGPAA